MSLWIERFKSGEPWIVILQKKGVRYFISPLSLLPRVCACVKGINRLLFGKLFLDSLIPKFNNCSPYYWLWSPGNYRDLTCGCYSCVCACSCWTVQKWVAVRPKTKKTKQQRMARLLGPLMVEMMLKGVYLTRWYSSRGKLAISWVSKARMDWARVN